MSTQRGGSERLRRGAATVGRYVAGALIGAVVCFAIGGAVLVTVMHYANELAGFDTKGSVASIALGTLLATPLIGLAAGAGFVHRRRRRSRPGASRPRPTGAVRRRSSAPTRRGSSAAGPTTRSVAYSEVPRGR